MFADELLMANRTELKQETQVKVNLNQIKRREFNEIR